MALPLTVIAGILGGVGKHILEVPIIHRAIENYFEGTRTIWDGILWRAFEAAAGIASPAEREVVVMDAASKVQDQYDEVKARVAEGTPFEEALRQVVPSPLDFNPGS